MPQLRSRARGNGLVTSFECARQVLVQRIIEIVGDDETPFINAEYRTALLDWNQPRHRPSGARDDDLFPFDDLTQQPGQMSLGLMDGNLVHACMVD